MKYSLSIKTSILMSLIGLLIVFSGCKKKESKVVIAFERRAPNDAEVKKQLDQDKKELGEFKPQGESQAVVDAFINFNKSIFTKQQDIAAQEKVSQDLKTAIFRCLEVQGQEAFKKTTLWLLDKFEKDLKALLFEVKDSKTANPILVGARLPPAVSRKFMKFAETGGDFLRHADKAGLIQRNYKGGLVLLPDSAFFMRLAFKIRLANILPETTHAKSWLLSKFENRWYHIWVIERSRSSQLPRQLKHIKELAAIDSNYRQDLARGIVYFQNRHFPEAVKSFSQAADKNPKDKRARAFLEQAKKFVK
jgi:hypothetical protein